MKRREFIRKAAAGTAATGILAGCRSSSEGPAVITRPSITWRMASSYPRSLDTLFGAAELFCSRVAALTAGKFRIRPYPAGELVPGLQVMDAVQQGTVQCGQTASYYYTGKHDALAFETCVPFGLTTRQQFAWLYRGGGMELLQEILNDFNVILLPGGSTGAQMGGWFRREINSLEDLNGLKMRIPGLGGEVMDRLGVTVQVLAGSDIYLALERGAIDATEWVGPHDDEKLGFHKVAKYYYYPGWWEPGAMLSHFFNRTAFEKLPGDYQEAVRSATAETASWMTASYDSLNPAALKRLLQAGVELRRFPDDMMKKAQSISFEIMEQKASEDASYRKVYDNWKAFRRDSFEWFGTNEHAYQQFAFGKD